MLRDQYPVGQRLRCVAGEDRDFDLAEYLTRIELLADEMHGCAAFCVAGGEAGLMSPEPLVFRQEGRVDVEDSAVPPDEEFRGNDAHEPRECDQLDLAFSSAR